jgi:hypothetical protein
MSPRRAKRAVLATAALGALLTAAAVGHAEGAATSDTLPATGASLGIPVSILVTLRSPADGAPVANAPVVFHTDAAFAGVTGEVEIGRAVSNKDGVAALTYRPHITGDHEIRVDYEDVGRKVNLGTVTVSVTGDSQLYRSTAGLRIPGLSVWTLITLVAVVWAILLGVALRVIAIARAGEDVPQPADGPSPNRPGGQP